MPINWGGILSGAITGARGIQEGISERRKMEQQALRQELADLLLQTQISNYQSLIADRAKPTPVPPVHLSPVTDPVTGDVSGYNPVTNTLTPSGGRIHPKPAATNTALEKNRAGASTAVESIDDAEGLLMRNPDADVIPLGAALARGAKTQGGIIGAIAGAAEPLAQRSMTPDQQQFQADMQRMAHSMVGLLPGSRQSIVLFNSLVNAYTPQPGESAQTRGAKRAARLRARHWLDAVARGQKVPVPPELSAAGITEADIQAPDSEASPSLDEEGAPADFFPPSAPPAPPNTAPKPKYHPRFRRP